MLLSGQFSVSGSGAATYTIPIAAPPGTAGVTPGLSLEYSSQGANGMLGLGWSLGGLPSIVRCPQTMAQDGVRGSVKFDANDRYCLDGARLVAIAGSYGADGTEYRTEIESFSRVISHGAAGAGPSWFEVRTKGGQVMEFGRTADAQSLLQGAATVRVWSVNRVSDVKGNFFTVTYTNDAGNGQVYPSQIDYTGNSVTGLSPYNKVQFTYEARPDTIPLYVTGYLVRTMQRLTHVKTFAGSALVADYQLAYQSSSIAPRSLIGAITVCAADGTCLLSTTFGWTPRGLIGAISRGLGAPTSITYESLSTSSAYVQDQTATYPVQDIKRPIFIVSRIDASNGVGGTYSSTYGYVGAKLDLNGRGFLGFRQTSVKDLQTGITDTTTYRQDFPFAGLVASTARTIGTQTLGQSANTYKFSNVAGAASVSAASTNSSPYKVSLSQNVSSGADLDGSALPTVTTSNQYDAYLNATQVVVSTPDGFSKATTNTFTNDTSLWHLGRLTRATVSNVAP